MQQKIELQEAIDELWELMRIVKKSYSRGKKSFHCGVDWRVKNDEGKDNAAYGQQRTRVWDPGKMKSEDT